MPGNTNPDTPTTSFTRTETARIPGGMIGASPKPLPRAARRPSKTGSSSRILLMTGRSMTSSTVDRAQLKLVKIPKDLFPHGGFSKVEDVSDRPVIADILLDEPVFEGRLAARGSGLGLAPIIPPGMRAVSVRVNEVVGVSGFVLPGMRVDVLVTGRPPNYNGTITTTVLQNIVVLSAGHTLQPESRGQAINVPVVTLLVSPEEAEILTLAGNEGRIQLVLRNGTDKIFAKTQGRDLSELYGFRRNKPEPGSGVSAKVQAVTTTVRDV